MKQDYRPGESLSKNRTWFGRRQLLLAVSLAGVVGLTLLKAAQLNDRTTVSSRHEAQSLTLPAPDPNIQALADTLDSEPDTQNWEVATVQRGDTLSNILERMDLPPETTYQLLAATEGKRLTRLYPEQQLEFSISPNRELSAMKFPITSYEYLVFSRENDGFQVSNHQVNIEKRVAYTEATISSSLYEAGKKAGIPDQTLMELAQIFQWDVDFAMDIRPGDSFRILYEQGFVAGEMLPDMHILAAEFINRGQSYRALWWEDSDGHGAYYTPEGQSLKKAFLRTPVNFSRISSHFNLKRRHPILHTIRAHRGVDYAAPTGTPVKASGDGKVIFKGKKGGYGNAIILQHGSQYTTLYGHLSRFHRHLKQGSTVKQGQVIGYVGSTGMATGPHLHYEFRVNGQHRNPLTVSLPNASPLPERVVPLFKARTSEWLALLDTHGQTELALKED